MLPRTLFAFILIALLGSSGSCWAKKKKDDGPAPLPCTIMEVSAMSLTVDLGKDVHQTYLIADNTKVFLAGTPVTTDDLRAGMAATVQLAGDNHTVVSLMAQDAPRVIKKGKKLGTDAWW